MADGSGSPEPKKNADGRPIGSLVYSLMPSQFFEGMRGLVRPRPSESQPKAPKRPSAVVLDHPKLWGAVALLALGASFSPRASLVAMWVCLSLAAVLFAFMWYGFLKSTPALMASLLSVGICLGFGVFLSAKPEHPLTVKEIGDEFDKRMSRPPVEAQHHDVPAATTSQTERLLGAKQVIEMSPKALTQIYKDNTAYQADTLMQVYKGKWVRLEINVGEVASVAAGSVDVLGKENNSLVSPTLSLQFVGDRVSTVNYLRRGTRLRAICQIQRAGQGFVFYTACEVRP